MFNNTDSLKTNNFKYSNTNVLTDIANYIHTHKKDK
jgi:hypothetical protein